MRRWMLLLALAGCSDDPSFDPPPPEAVASCSLVQKGSRPYESALWFDASSRLIQIDEFGPQSVRLEYDDQNRVVRTSSRSWWTTLTYAPSRITTLDSSGNTDVIDLDADGRVVHMEGPEELEASMRNRSDIQYDSAGHITSYTGAVRWSKGEDQPVMISPFSYQFTYDDQGRVATSKSDLQQAATSYTYSETPGHLTINVTDQYGSMFPWTYDFDDAGRVVHAQVDGNQSYKNAYSYTYVDDTIAAIPDGSTEAAVTATGACPGIASSLTVDKPLTFNPLEQNGGHSTIWLPNPPVDPFAGYGYSL